VQAQQSSDLAASTAAVPSGSTGMFKTHNTVSNKTSLPTVTTTAAPTAADSSNSEKIKTTTTNSNAQFGLWGANNHFVPGSGLGLSTTSAETDGVEKKRRWTVDQGSGR